MLGLSEFVKGPSKGRHRLRVVQLRNGRGQLEQQLAGGHRGANLRTQVEGTGLRTG